MWLRTLPSGRCGRYTYNHHAQALHSQGLSLQTVRRFLSLFIDPTTRSWLRPINTYPTSIPVLLLAIITSCRHRLSHTFRRRRQCQQKQLEWRPNRLQWLHPSSRPQKPKKTPKCIGDHAPVGKDIGGCRIQRSYQVDRVLYLPTTQEEVRRRQGYL